MVTGEASKRRSSSVRSLHFLTGALVVVYLASAIGPVLAGASGRS